MDYKTETMIKDELESIIDKNGLNYTLSLIADVCFLKADHLSVNWQSHISAKWWSKKGKRIQTAAK